jgi:hypothetical protein
MTLKSVAPRCPDGQHELYNRARPGTRVTKCRKCRASVRIPARPDNPVFASLAAKPAGVPFTVIADKRATVIIKAVPEPEPEPETWTGTCDECGQEWEFTIGADAWCPVCDVQWICGQCDATRILSKADVTVYVQCERCGWTESQTLGELLAASLA